jgi:hypothetical protein
LNCGKCGEYFPNFIIVDGVKKTINRRRFCLNCSPYKKHNTRDLTKQREDHLCSCCKKVLTNENSYNRTDRDSKYPYCKTCLSIKTVERGRKLKKECVDYKGGKCQICGYNKYLGALEFHHRNPKEKDFSISNRYKNAKINERIKRELDKCDLVCSNCHREIHSELRG